MASDVYRAEITRFPERVRMRIEVPFLEKRVWVKPDLSGSGRTIEDESGSVVAGKMFVLYKLKDGFLSQVILTEYGQKELMKFTENDISIGKWAYIKIDNTTGEISVDEKNGE